MDINRLRDTSEEYQAPILDTSFSRCYTERLGTHSTEISPRCNTTVDQKKREKTISSEKQWYEHCKTLERLSTPKSEKERTFCASSRGKKIPLSQLCPRINHLSQARNPIKKREYVKDPDEFILPGKIKDWPAHCQWLHKNAQARKHHNNVQTPKEGRRLTRLKRTLWLCQPKHCTRGALNNNDSFTKPITPVTDKALNYYPSKRIMDLSEPKPFVIGRVYMEHVPEDCLMVVSSHAKKCKASRRVKSLSLPKGCSQCYCASELYDLGGGESCQSDSRLHKLSASKICQTIRPKDYRHVKYLDVYRIGKQFPANDTTHHKSQQPYHHANKC